MGGRISPWIFFWKEGKSQSEMKMWLIILNPGSLWMVNSEMRDTRWDERGERKNIYIQSYAPSSIPLGEPSAQFTLSVSMYRARIRFNPIHHDCQCNPRGGKRMKVLLLRMEELVCMRREREERMKTLRGWKRRTEGRLRWEKHLRLLNMMIYYLRLITKHNFFWCQGNGKGG